MTLISVTPVGLKNRTKQSKQEKKKKAHLGYLMS